MKTQVILGVDPGITGAMAFNGLDIIWVEDLPTVTIPNQRRKETQLDPIALANRLKEVQKRCQLFAYLEKTHAMKDSAMTAFSMGFTRGVILSVLACLEIPVVDVLPNAWKKKFGLIRCDKDASIGVAKQQYPQCSEHLNRKKDHNRAEAILISEYGFSQHFGNIHHVERNFR